MSKKAKDEEPKKKPNCRGVSTKKCPGSVKKLCKSIFCYFKKWKAWAIEVREAFKELDKYRDAILALQDHVYDEKAADLTKRLKKGTISPDVGPPPDPPFGDE